MKIENEKEKEKEKEKRKRKNKKKKLMYQLHLNNSLQIPFFPSVLLSILCI